MGPKLVLDVLWNHIGSTAAVNYTFPRPLASPQGWADAGVGIGFGWDGGIPLIENKDTIQMFESI